MAVSDYRNSFLTIKERLQVIAAPSSSLYSKALMALQDTARSGVQTLLPILTLIATKLQLYYYHNILPYFPLLSLILNPFHLSLLYLFKTN
jgi:hypothetical protein